MQIEDNPCIFHIHTHTFIIIKMIFILVTKELPKFEEDKKKEKGQEFFLYYQLAVIFSTEPSLLIHLR